MVVAQQHDLHRRQVPKSDRWGTNSPWTGKRHRAGAVAPDRISEHIQAVGKLEEKGSMADKSRSHLTRFNLRWQGRFHDFRLHVSRPGFGSALELPSQYILRGSIRRHRIRVINL